MSPESRMSRRDFLKLSIGSIAAMFLATMCSGDAPIYPESNKYASEPDEPLPTENRFDTLNLSQSLNHNEVFDPLTSTNQWETENIITISNALPVINQSSNLQYNLALLSFPIALDAISITAPNTYLISLGEKAAHALIRASETPIVSAISLSLLLALTGSVQSVSEGTICALGTCITEQEQSLLRTRGIIDVFITDPYSEVRVMQINDSLSHSDTDALIREREKIIHPKIPSNWPTPPKDHCNQNVQEYFAQLMFKKVTGYLIMDEFHQGTPIENIESKNLISDYDESYKDRFAEISEKFDIKKHPECGWTDIDNKTNTSMFIVFKRIESGRAFPSSRGLNEWISEQNFTLDSSAQDVYNTIYQFVDTWWSY